MLSVATSSVTTCFRRQDEACSSCADVQEPPTDSALLQHAQVTTTPHLGASTVDAQTRVAVDIARQFIAFTRQTALTGAVSTRPL